jgi:hypothetical protein
MRAARGARQPPEFARVWISGSAAGARVESFASAAGHVGDHAAPEGGERARPAELVAQADEVEVESIA